MFSLKGLDDDLYLDVSAVVPEVTPYNDRLQELVGVLI